VNSFHTKKQDCASSQPSGSGLESERTGSQGFSLIRIRTDGRNGDGQVVQEMGEHAGSGNSLIHNAECVTDLD